jgi:hypothetical protein
MPSPALRTIPKTPLGVDMVSPGDQFVRADGTLSPVSFRFLFRLWNALSGEAEALTALRRDSATRDETADLARQLVALQERVAALEGRAP